MKYIFLLCFLVGSSAFARAQEGNNAVIVHKDPRIELLVKKRIEINEKTTRDNRRTAKGFRIQVINTRERNVAINAKTQILQTFPEHQSYIVFNAPFFKLKLGNFKTRGEAEQVLRKVAKYYPEGVFIIADMIEVKPGIPEEQEL